MRGLDTQPLAPSGQDAHIEKYKGKFTRVPESDTDEGSIRLDIIGLGKVFGYWRDSKFPSDMQKSTSTESKAARSVEMDALLYSAVPPAFKQNMSAAWLATIAASSEKNWRDSEDGKMVSLYLSKPVARSLEEQIHHGHLIMDVEEYFSREAGGRTLAQNRMRSAWGELPAASATQEMVDRSDGAILTRLTSYTNDEWQSLSDSQQASEFDHLKSYVSVPCLYGTISNDEYTYVFLQSDPLEDEKRAACTNMCSIQDVRARIGVAEAERIALELSASKASAKKGFFW